MRRGGRLNPVMRISLAVVAGVIIGSCEKPLTFRNILGPSPVYMDAGKHGGYKKARRSMGNIIKENLNPDGIDRRGFLKCMAWAGTGALCVMQGGVLKSFALGPGGKSDKAMKG